MTELKEVELPQRRHISNAQLDAKCKCSTNLYFFSTLKHEDHADAASAVVAALNTLRSVLTRCTYSTYGVIDETIFGKSLTYRRV